MLVFYRDAKTKAVYFHPISHNSPRQLWGFCLTWAVLLITAYFTLSLTVFFCFGGESAQGDSNTRLFSPPLTSTSVFIYANCFPDLAARNSHQWRFEKLITREGEVLPSVFKGVSQRRLKYKRCFMRVALDFILLAFTSAVLYLPRSENLRHSGAVWWSRHLIMQR